MEAEKLEMQKVESKLWSNAQAYALAVICLLLGAGTGYLAHAPSQAAVKKPVAKQEVPAGAASGMAATPEQLKQMADQKVAPLLAQLQKNPNDIALLNEIAKTYFQAHQFPASAEYCERAVKIKPDPGMLTTLGVVYHYAGDDNKALDALNRALQIDPKNANALFNLGMLKWESQSDPKAAIAAWEKLLKTNPNFPGRANVKALIAGAKKHTSMPSAGNTDKPSKDM